MRSFRLFNRQTVGYVVAVAGILLGAFVPALANAADVTERSIELSSSSKSANNVTYTVNFTSVGAASAFVVDFCSDSPIIGTSCAAPTDFSATGAGATGDFTATGSTNTVIVHGDIAAATAISVPITGITNPSTTDPLYARIVTYDTTGHADAYTSEIPGAGVVDKGSVAISITDTIGVSGAVLESMTFCIAGAAIPAGCDLDGLAAPTLKLGSDPGTGVVALIPTDVSEGHIYTQLTTNAANGAVVNLKSNAVGCGGLINSSKPGDCYIKPAVTPGITAGQALFGVKTSTATGGSDILVPSGSYSNSAFSMHWVSGDQTGVTSTYGDPFLNTGGLPANNMNMDLTFGASVDASTPAGSYSADLGMIATGKF